MAKRSRGLLAAGLMLVLAAVMPARAQDANIGDDVVSEKLLFALPDGFEESNAARIFGGRRVEYTPGGVGYAEADTVVTVHHAFRSRAASPQRFIDDTIVYTRGRDCQELTLLTPQGGTMRVGHFTAAVQSMHCATRELSRQNTPGQRRHELAVIFVVEGGGGDYYWLRWLFHTDEEEGIEERIRRQSERGLAFLRTAKLCDETSLEPCLSESESE